MEALKIRRFVVAAAVMFAALGLPVSANNLEEQGTRQNPVESSTVSPQAPASVLTIGGKEDPDVYLQSLDIQVEVTGNIASTRYTMVFKNKTDRVLEGELTFPLPDGRSVTHYALDINGRMREAVPVEKARATQVFEEIQRRPPPIDPGILEKVEGNNFRTRIYPFPRNGTRTISIGYEEELPLENDSLRYRLPMAYAAPLDNFSIKATVWKSGVKPVVPESDGEIRFDRAGENHVASFVRKNYRPSRALAFALPAPVDVPQVIMQPAMGKFYFLASVAPDLETRRKRWSNDLAIIWDVSLSGTQRNLRREMEMLDAIFAEKKNASVHLYFLNNKFTKSVNKNTAKGEYKVVNGNWDGLKKVLETAVFDGGTDFSKINLRNIAGDEILFFSDGISTLSDADFLKNSNINRPIHCIVSSSSADYSAMKLIAGRTMGKFVNINALSSDELKNEALNETPQFLGTVHGNPVREVYPSNIATPVHGYFSVAGISDTGDAELILLFGFGGKVEKGITVKLDAGNIDSLGNIHKIWAQKKAAELDLDYENNRAGLAELGRRFGIVTRNTSLMVLELVSDYVHFGIEPPAADTELYAEYQLRKGGRREPALRSMLDTAAAAVNVIKTWRDTDYWPKKSVTGYGSGYGSKKSGIGYGLGYGTEYGAKPNKEIDEFLKGLMGPGPSDSGPNLKKKGRDPSANLLRGGTLTGAGSTYSAGDKEEEKISRPVIKIKAVRSDNDYLGKLTGKIADDYKTYLELRDDYAGSPAFYLDMADWFYKRKSRETALRVLTSIAELGLEDASLYRLLGYRFKEYGERALQEFVCRKVVQWRPMDPQSYRDYALALADNGQAQAALDSLCSMLARPFPADNIRRSRGLAETAVTEINRLIAKNPGINTSRVDKRLIVSNPVDVRVVINWNMDNTDIDLYVRDPNREYCYYGRRQTAIGGRISEDARDGYGPEQFMLKRAVRGKYQISADYYGAREFAAAGPATVMAEIYIKYSGKAEQRTVVTLQLSKAKERHGEKTVVAEFVLGDPYPPSPPVVIHDTEAPYVHKGRDDRTQTLSSGRSRASIQRVVMQHMSSLRHTYNMRLRDKPGLSGRVTIRFAIDEFGKVVYAHVAESTMDDPKFENLIADRVRNWIFDRIDKPGDVTELTYPFFFSQ